MEFSENLKDFTKKQAIRKILELLSHVSEDNFLKLTYLAEKIVTDKSKSIVKTVREHLQTEGDPVKEIFHRVMTQVSPPVLKKITKNFFIDALMESEKVRDEFLKENGFRPPFTMIIDPTSRCNLNCLGCYAGKYKKGPELSFELIDRVLTEAKEMGIHFIAMTGGEPFFYPDILKVWQKHNDLQFMVYSNGTLVDEVMGEKLQDLGNVSPVISLEGFEEETDFRRGKGTFKKILRCFDNLKKQGIVTGASCMVTRKNIETVTCDAFIDFLIESGVFYLWYFLFVPVGKDPEINLMPTPEQREYLRIRDAEIRKTRPIFIGDFWNDAPAVGGCIAAGRNYLHIISSGEVQPCVFVHYAVDNIKEKSLKEILSSGFFKAIRARQPYSHNFLTPCMILDHPEVYREVIRSYKPFPTHEGAETILTTLRGQIDEYARKVRLLEDAAWEKEYVCNSENFCLNARKDYAKTFIPRN